MDITRLQAIPPRQRALPPREFIEWINKAIDEGTINRADATVLLKTHRDYRDELRKMKIAATMRKPTWWALNYSLTYDLAGARASLHSQRRLPPNRQNTALMELLEAYINIMLRVKAQIKETRAMYVDDMGLTLGRKECVAAFNTDRAAQGKTLIPNEGLHWVDWVPQRVKDSFAEAIRQAEAMRLKKGRSRVYFERRIPGTVRTTDEDHYDHKQDPIIGPAPGETLPPKPIRVRRHDPKDFTDD